MALPKKLALLSAIGIMGLSLAIGGTTYALFTSAATNSANTFTSGTLTMSAERNDLPITGPMFYTNDNPDGWSGTGLWAPGDNHTRGLFVRNTGSLDAKLSKVYAIPEGSGTELSDARAFAQQADVTIAVYAPNGNFDQTAYRRLMEVVDDWYKNEWNRALANGVADIAAYINESYINQVFHVKNVLGHDVSADVEQVYTGKISELLNGQNSPLLVNVPSQNTLLLGYTVSLPLAAGNSLQGKTVKFTFRNDFVQAKNN